MAETTQAPRIVCYPKAVSGSDAYFVRDQNDKTLAGPFSTEDGAKRALVRWIMTGSCEAQVQPMFEVVA